VEKHEQFEILCAAASVGQASGAELAELHEHLSECAECQRSYSDFLQLAAVRLITQPSEQRIGGDEAIGYIDSALFREEFLKKAEAEGIVFSSEKSPGRLSEPRVRTDQPIEWRIHSAVAVAASVVLALLVIGGYRFVSRRVNGEPQVANVPIQSTPLPARRQSMDQNDLEAAVLRLQTENRGLTLEDNSLKNSLADASSKISQLQGGAAASEKERNLLLSAVQSREAMIEDLQRQLNQAQNEVVNVKTDLDKAKISNQATLVADQARIAELSDQLAGQSTALEREKELLAANRDIRDLMAARNLHIADIFDTDTKGRTKSAFGRVFFTEGKSLIIYAYDLNDRRAQDAGYHYRVWGKKEGPGQVAKSLGIFYSDDKAQKRWVFKYDDPKVLSEIDSVFVTLEPPGNTPTEPKGDKFLYAYLRNQPNHP